MRLLVGDVISEWKENCRVKFVSSVSAVASLCLEAADSACFRVLMLDDFENRTYFSVFQSHCNSLSFHFSSKVSKDVLPENYL